MTRINYEEGEGVQKSLQRENMEIGDERMMGGGARNDKNWREKGEKNSRGIVNVSRISLTLIQVRKG